MTGFRWKTRVRAMHPCIISHRPQDFLSLIFLMWAGTKRSHPQGCCEDKCKIPHVEILHKQWNTSQILAFSTKCCKNLIQFYQTENFTYPKLSRKPFDPKPSIQFTKKCNKNAHLLLQRKPGCFILRTGALFGGRRECVPSPATPCCPTPQKAAVSTDLRGWWWAQMLQRGGCSGVRSAALLWRTLWKTSRLVRHADRKARSNGCAACSWCSFSCGSFSCLFQDFVQI